MIAAKKCKDCGKVKAAAEFWKRKASPDGLALYCRDCFAQRNSASYRKKQASLGKKTKDFRRRREDPEGMKYCPRCETVKAIEEFGSNRSKRSGNSSYCKPCWNTITREHRERRHGSSRNYLLKLRYGVTEEEVRQMIARQGGVCVICLRAAAEHVDHDHFSGAVRRILCFKCNGALGQFEDDPQRMLLAADYLELRGSQARMLENEVGGPVFGGPDRVRTDPRWRERRASTSTPRHYRLRQKYGITDEDADWLLRRQVGLCGVCSDRPGEHVDHDHATGAVRGIACTGCNSGMGQFGDDPTSLRRAADYVVGELVKTVPMPDGTTRLSFTHPDVDPASVPLNGWEPYRDADGERRRGNPSFGGCVGDGLTPLEVLVREIVARSGASRRSAASGASSCS